MDDSSRTSSFVGRPLEVFTLDLIVKTINFPSKMRKGECVPYRKNESFCYNSWCPFEFQVLRVVFTDSKKSFLLKHLRFREVILNTFFIF